MKKQILFLGDCFMKNFHSIVLINSLLLLYGFGCIQASNCEKYKNLRDNWVKQEKEDNYKKYFEHEKDERSRNEERYRQEQKELYKKHFERQEEEKYKEYIKQKQQQEKDQAAAEFLKNKKAEAYKSYFKQQEEIYQGLLKSGIAGARRLNIDQDLAEIVFATCPRKVKNAISDIRLNMFCADQKNIMLRGILESGKTSLAQAIAIKDQIPCLFINAGDVSDTENLRKIFEFARSEQKRLSKPCIIIFDELEALISSDITKNNHGNILIKFWKRLSDFKDNGMVVIGTIDGIENLPDQITQKTSMVEISLPNLEDREATLSYYQDKYNLIYPQSITAVSIAKQTEGSSNRELKNLVERIIKLVKSDKTKDDKINDIATEINKIKKNPKRELARAIGTWGHAFKKNLDPRALTAAGLVVTLHIAHKYMAIQEKGQAIQEAGLKQAAYIAERQADIQERGLKQAAAIADRQASGAQIAKQAAINASVLGIPIGPILAGGGYGCKNGFQWIVSKIW